MPHDGVFDTFEDLMRALNDRASKEGYKIVKARSHRVRIVGTDPHSNPMNRCDLVCDRGGRPYKSMATKHKTSTKKTDCPWKAKAVLRKTIGGWVLTIMCDQHNHEPGTPEPPTPPAVEEEDGEGEDAEGMLCTNKAKQMTVLTSFQETRKARGQIPTQPWPCRFRA